MTGATPAPPLFIRQLRKSYADVVAVDGIDLEVRPGECFGLLGPNGAGKTTTIEICEGLTDPDAGEVVVLGRRWGHDDRAIRALLGISLQETQFSDKLTVAETVQLFRSFYPRGPAPPSVIELVQLGEKANARVGQLSGGQRQRLALACALVGDPELLFLDEPTTGLDPQSRRQLWDVLRAFRARGRTILLTTHYMDEAEKLCDRIAVMDGGVFIALGTPAELIRTLGGDHVVEVTVASDTGAPPPLERWKDLPSVRVAHASGDALLFTVAEPHVAIPALLARLEADGFTLSNLTTRHASLEDVFVSLTGRHLRDE